jgi:hypothetical protein
MARPFVAAVLVGKRHACAHQRSVANAHADTHRRFDLSHSGAAAGDEHRTIEAANFGRR